MDLLSIIASTDKYNFHTHTQFCDGRDSMHAIANSAVQAGFEHLGFTPHSPIAIPSSCNMSTDDVDAYRSEVQQLNAHLPINIYMGMEIDYLSREHGPAAQYFHDLGLDFAIGSVHFIPTRRGNFVDIDGPSERFNRNMSAEFDNDLRYVVETFYKQSVDMIAAGGFDILGHFDKIVQNGALYAPQLEEEGWYNDLVEDFIDVVIASGLIVEINTKARERLGRFFPHERHWQRLVDAGVPIMVNSDAHYSALINASRDEALSLLNKCRHGSCTAHS